MPERHACIGIEHNVAVLKTTFNCDISVFQTPAFYTQKKEGLIIPPFHVAFHCQLMALSHELILL
jgi:hypothetical protein